MNPQITHPEHIFLYNLAIEQLKRFPTRWLMEIGSFRGESSFALASAIKDSPRPAGFFNPYLVCIDPFYGHYDAGLEQVLIRENLGNTSFGDFCKRLEPLLDVVFPIACTRSKVEEVHNNCGFVIPNVSLAFVDGSHVKEDVYQDIVFAWSRLSLGGGCLVLHDACWDGVKWATDKFCKEKKITPTYHLGATGENDAPLCVIYK